MLSTELLAKPGVRVGWDTERRRRRRNMTKATGKEEGECRKAEDGWTEYVSLIAEAGWGVRVGGWRALIVQPRSTWFSPRPLCEDGREERKGIRRRFSICFGFGSPCLLLGSAIYPPFPLLLTMSTLQRKSKEQNRKEEGKEKHGFCISN